MAKIVSAAFGGAHSAAVTENGAATPRDEEKMILQEPTGLGHDDLEDNLMPTLVAPLHQLGARVGRCLPVPPSTHSPSLWARTAGWEQVRRGRGQEDVAAVAGEAG